MAKKVTVTKDLACRIYNLIQNGASKKDILETFGISDATYGRIKNRRGRYSDLLMDCEDTEVTDAKETSVNDSAEATEAEAKEPTPEEKGLAKVRSMNEEIFLNDVTGVLLKYMNPVLVKFCIDNYILDEKIKDMVLVEMVAKIKEADSIEFYAQALQTVVIGILIQLFPEDVVNKILRS